jgi:uncharacterized protein YjbI with pentapeptide repeats
LREACFREANLSNAHFERADLRGASFAAADCEGADFTGADLREVDLRCASLFGASFCAESTTANAGHSCAIIDGTTRIDSSAIEQLTPTQQEFVQKAMAR